MQLTATEFWFWQNSVSPHMFDLAVELSCIGFPVRYICDVRVNPSRSRLGWGQLPESRVRVEIGMERNLLRGMIAQDGLRAVHFVEGIRGSRFIRTWTRILEASGCTVVPMLERWDSRGILGVARRILYRNIVMRRERFWSAVLSIGAGTGELLRVSGVPPPKILPFSYFLRSSPIGAAHPSQTEHPYRFIFVGNLIRRKAVDLLLNALERVLDLEWQLVVIGQGPEESKLRRMAAARLGRRMEWAGLLTGKEVHQRMADADCLVLPSRHDGWGAVVSEALQVGTPVICSDACGASEFLVRPILGTRFESESVQGLEDALRRQLAMGVVSSLRRDRIRTWARCLAPHSGAEYVHTALAACFEGRKLPVPPWMVGMDALG